MIEQYKGFSIQSTELVMLLVLFYFMDTSSLNLTISNPTAIIINDYFILIKYDVCLSCMLPHTDILKCFFWLNGFIRVFDSLLVTYLYFQDLHRTYLIFTVEANNTSNFSYSFTYYYLLICCS